MKIQAINRLCTGCALQETYIKRGVWNDSPELCTPLTVVSLISSLNLKILLKRIGGKIKGTVHLRG